eukprot:519346-Amphidinium_carterae.1
MVGAGCVALARLLDTLSFVTMLVASSSSLRGSFPVASLDLLLREHRVFLLDWIAHSSFFCLVVVMPHSQTRDYHELCQALHSLADQAHVRASHVLVLGHPDAEGWRYFRPLSWCTEYTESQLCRWSPSGPRRGWLSLLSTFSLSSLGGPCPSHECHRPLRPQEYLQWPPRFCAELAKIFVSEAVKIGFDMAVRVDSMADLAHNLQKGHRKHQPRGNAVPPVVNEFKRIFWMSALEPLPSLHRRLPAIRQGGGEQGAVLVGECFSS